MTLVVTLAEARGGQAGTGTGTGTGARADAVGGKGASLGELARAHVAVPAGFVVTVEAFAAALAAADHDGALRAGIEALDAADNAGIARVASHLRAVITATPLPDEVASAVTAGYAGLGSAPGGPVTGGPGAGGPGAGGPGAGGSTADGSVAGRPAPGGGVVDDSAAGDQARDGDGVDVAVRSSATVEDSAEASFAGLQDTYLGVSGAVAVLDHVRRCWASLYNDESVAYRRRLGLPESDVAMAVVVQRMVAPRAAGVMFTRSPLTGDRSVVAIEGVWGLGSALVSGDVTPDSWVISKITGEITARRVSTKTKLHRYAPHRDAAPAVPPADSPGGGTRVTVADTPTELRDAPCLTDDEIRALAAVARRVEAHYGAPQDIEWAVLDAPFTPASGAAATAASTGPAGGANTGSAGGANTGPADAASTAAAPAAKTASVTPPGAAAPESGVESRVVLLQSRPETVWAAREVTPAGAPKPRAADHVLSLFGKPL
jgi:pyruvate,water dikinase